MTTTQPPPPIHLLTSDRNSHRKLLSLLFKLLNFPPPAANVGHHFFHQRFLRHRSNLLMIVETPTLGNLPLLFSSSSTFPLPPPSPLHLEFILYAVAKLINVVAGLGPFRPNSYGWARSSLAHKKKDWFVGSLFAQPKPVGSNRDG